VAFNADAEYRGIARKSHVIRYKIVIKAAIKTDYLSSFKYERQARDTHNISKASFFHALLIILANLRKFMTLFLYTEIKKKRKKYVIINSLDALY